MESKQPESKEKIKEKVPARPVEQIREVNINNLEELRDPPRLPRSLQVESDQPSKLVFYATSKAVSDPFTPGALKNIITISESQVNIYEAKEDSIDLYSSNQLTEQQRGLFIEYESKYSYMATTFIKDTITIIFTEKKNSVRFLSFKLDLTTGEVIKTKTNSYQKILLPSTPQEGLEQALRNLLNEADQGRLTNLTPAEGKFRGMSHPRLSKLSRFFVINQRSERPQELIASIAIFRNGAVRDYFKIKKSEKNISLKFEQFTDSLRRSGNPVDRARIAYNEYLTNLFDFNPKRSFYVVIHFPLTKLGWIMLELVDLRTKKLLCTRVINLDDFLAPEVTQAFDRLLSIEERLESIRVVFNQIKYLTLEKTLLLVMGLQTTHKMVLRISDVFEKRGLDIKVMDVFEHTDFLYFHEPVSPGPYGYPYYSRIKGSNNLIYLKKNESDDADSSQLYHINMKNREETLLFDFSEKNKMRLDRNLNNSYEYFKLSNSRILAVRGSSSAIIDLCGGGIIAKKRHQLNIGSFKILCGSDDVRPKYAGDLVAWSYLGIIQIFRIGDKVNREDMCEEKKFYKEIFLQEILSRKLFVGIGRFRFKFIHLSSGNYMIYLEHKLLLAGDRDEVQRQERRLFCIELDSSSLEVVQVTNSPLNFEFRFFKETEIVETNGFLLLKFKFQNCNLHKICLSSLQLDVFDGFTFEDYQNEGAPWRKKQVDFIWVNSAKIVVSQTQYNSRNGIGYSLYYFRINKEHKTLVLIKKVDLNSKWPVLFQNISQSDEGFCLAYQKPDPEGKDNSFIVTRFDQNLSEVGSLVLKGLNLANPDFKFFSLVKHLLIYRDNSLYCLDFEKGQMEYLGCGEISTHHAIMVDRKVHDRFLVFPHAPGGQMRLIFLK